MPERMVSLLYGEVEAKEEKAIRAHLKECAACRQAFDELKSTSTILGQWEDVTPKRDRFCFYKGTGIRDQSLEGPYRRI
jgi:hypothetical protein